MEIVTDNLKLIVMDNFLEFGEKVDQHLKLMNGKPLDGSFSYMVPVELPRFSNGESKAVIKETVRDHYATSKILTDFFATEFINDIFYQNDMAKTDNKREVYNLEKLIHANTKNREDLSPERINNYIHDFIEPRDKALAHHIANNLNLVEELKKDLTYVYNKWDYYMERLEARRRVILDDEIENIIKSHNIEVLFDVYELVNYILVSLGHQPIEDEFTIYNENSEVELIKKLKSGVELDYKEQMLVTYLTILIKKLYAKDIIDETPTDYNDYQKQDGELINVNFSAKK